MKTLTNIENVTRKLGRTVLAVLLISLTCVSPLTYNAFAEENEDPTATAQVAPEDTTESAPIAQVSDDATDTEATVPEAATNEVTTDDAIMTAAADDSTIETAATDDHVINVSTPMELMDAFKYDINSQSNQTFVINLDADISLAKPETNAHTMDTHGKRFFIGTDRLLVKNGNTVTILGHGHSLTYDDTSTTNLTLGTKGGNLILGAADGSDTLNITFVGSDHDIQALVNAVGGTVAIHEGVTLSNNVNGTGYPGGAISASNGAVVTMDGGTIASSSNRNITWGGGVSIDDGEFHMTGGKITGNSETAYGDYLGYGGGVALSAHGGHSVFTMSGDAVIEGNSAPNGGGVYVGPKATFTMSGNAAIVNNTATTQGGGVYVAEGGTFTMDDDAVVTGNNAPYGGGVINYGTATVSNIYDNDATKAGADIYNDGTLSMSDVKAEWSLSKAQATSDPNGAGAAASAPGDDRPDLHPIVFMSMAEPATLSTASEGAIATDPSNTQIDGWYYDGHRETGETDENGNAVVEHNRWNANEDTADTPQYLQSYAVTGQPTTETMGLKAAHGTAAATEPDDGIKVIWENEDGTVLYTMDDVDPTEIPAADEYNTLSGNEDPTEPDENGYSYDFEGWTKTSDDAGDVIYIAEYKAMPETHTDTPDEPDPVIPDEPDSDQPAYPADQPATHEGDDEVAGPATPKADDNTKAEEATDTDGTYAPRLGDDPAGLLLAMGVAMGGAGIALRQVRRAREQ